jgi:hypothetical protein
LFTTVTARASSPVHGIGYGDTVSTTVLGVSSLSHIRRLKSVTWTSRADGSCTGCSARRCLGYGPELLDELSRVKVVHWEPAPTG